MFLSFKAFIIPCKSVSYVHMLIPCLFHWTLCTMRPGNFSICSVSTNMLSSPEPGPWWAFSIHLFTWIHELSFLPSHPLRKVLLSQLHEDSFSEQTRYACINSANPKLCRGFTKAPCGRGHRYVGQIVKSKVSALCHQIRKPELAQATFNF